ncbi:MAG: hypothetical protein H6625_01405 [Bdellovibrionaceae bacterium]|nr:hypothetical protein [Pseudobdellovibrionaceae bacterium]
MRQYLSAGNESESRAYLLVLQGIDYCKSVGLDESMLFLVRLCFSVVRVLQWLEQSTAIKISKDSEFLHFKFCYLAFDQLVWGFNNNFFNEFTEEEEFIIEQIKSANSKTVEELQELLGEIKNRVALKTSSIRKKFAYYEDM